MWKYFKFSMKRQFKWRIFKTSCIFHNFRWFSNICIYTDFSILNKLIIDCLDKTVRAAISLCLATSRTRDCRNILLKNITKKNTIMRWKNITQKWSRQSSEKKKIGTAGRERLSSEEKKRKRADETKIWHNETEQRNKHSKFRNCKLRGVVLIDTQSKNQLFSFRDVRNDSAVW